MSEKETKAIELKYNGEKYENIARAVGIALPTVKDWFSTGGKLKNYYLDYETEQSELSRNEARKVIARNTHNASETLVNLLNSKTDQVRLKAAEAILERELGEPTEQSGDKKDLVRLLREVERERVGLPRMVVDEIRKIPEPRRGKIIEIMRKHISYHEKDSDRGLFNPHSMIEEIEATE